MTAAATSRRLWQCPDCGRSFRIPADAELPRRCPECLRADSAAAATQPPPAPAPPPPPASAALPEAPDMDPAVWLVDRHLQSIATRLDEISRSMTGFRRALWAFVGVALIGVAVNAYTIYSTAQTVGGLFGGQSAGSAELEQVREGLNDYQRTLNELLKDVNQR
ncbi:MAG: hypothetical protein KY476_18790 [Planctomycetes bacterium]|nr:hypothetical protein [Planctomycetota bacterium]